MKKYGIFLYFISIIFGQVSVDDINKLSNAELDLIRNKLLPKGSSSVNVPEKNVSTTNTGLSSVEIKSTPSSTSPVYFGYDYFKRDIVFFDNIPTPSDYKLGPGDEITISLWGQINSRENFVINKEGLIYYNNIGFINLSNQNLEEAEKILTEELSRVYSTLKDSDSPTKLMLELGKIKSINVYFSGQIENPGVNLVHPFSDIFSAIVQAGGIKNEGSLRKIELIRDGKAISIVDFYSFFTNGKNNSSSIKILDGDIIHIPEVSNRVAVSGEVLNAGFFELIKNESIYNLIDYAGGLTANASSYAILDIIIPVSERSSDDNAKTSMNISLNESKNIKINNGSILNILPISKVETKATVLGRVKSPGDYAPSSLKNILNLAGGFNDPLYRKTIRDEEIVILRKDENQFYAKEFKISYNKSDSFQLIPGDKIFVYENTQYNNLFSVEVTGSVNKRGSFQLKEGMTVRDAINLAEGFSPVANKEAIIVIENFSFIDDSGNEIKEKKQVKDASLDFSLTDGSIINVLPLENVVSVEGNVYNPGLVTYAKAKTVNKYINLAGGPKPNTLSTKIFVKRANGRIKKVSLFQGIGTIVRPGDIIFVPVDENPNEFDITSFIADLASTLANIAAILVIIDNQD